MQLGKYDGHMAVESENIHHGVSLIRASSGIQLSPAVLPIDTQAKVTGGSEGAKHLDPGPPGDRGQGFDALPSASARRDMVTTPRAECDTWRSSHGEEGGAW